jgi:hypothetical protein
VGPVTLLFINPLSLAYLLYFMHEMTNNDIILALGNYIRALLFPSTLTLICVVDHDHFYAL